MLGSGAQKTKHAAVGMRLYRGAVSFPNDITNGMGKSGLAA